MEAAEGILGGLLRADGRLGRSWKDGRSSGEGVLEDYADLADGLLALYTATFDERWFASARSLADSILDHFMIRYTASHPGSDHPGSTRAAGECPMGAGVRRTDDRLRRTEGAEAGHCRRSTETSGLNAKPTRALSKGPRVGFTE